MSLFEGLRSGRPVNQLWLVVGAAALLLVLLLPLLGSNTQLRLFTDFFKVAVMAMGWNLIGGFTGYASFGQVVFFGIGAYGTGFALTTLGWSIFPAIGLGILLGVAFAVVLGIPVLRLKGHYFAIATLGAAEATREIVRNLDIVNANEGLVLPPILEPQFFYFVTLGMLIAVTIGIWLITKTPFGYGLRAIREDEEAAEVLGINAQLYKTSAFALSALIVAMIGGIHIYHVSYIEPIQGFNVLLTVEMIVMSVIGGAGTVLGPIIGAAMIFFPAEYLASISDSLRTLPVIFFGALLVLFSLFLPQGLMEILTGRQKLSLSLLLSQIRAHRVS